MPDRVQAGGAPGDARRAIRLALERIEPGLRVVAEDVLALQTRIDLVGVDAQRRIVAIVIAAPGHDAPALARALAHREWLREHLPDWLKLAPDLGADPRCAVRSLVIAARFAPETLAAVAALPAGWVELIRARADEPNERPAAGLERVSSGDAGGPAQVDGPPDGRRSPPAFRSGLTAEELGLTRDESASFD